MSHPPGGQPPVDVERLQRIANNALRGLPALAAAQKAAEKQQQAQATAMSHMITQRIGPTLELLRKSIEAYASFTVAHQGTIEQLRRTAETAAAAIRMQLELSPQLVEALATVAAAQAAATRVETPEVPAGSAEEAWAEIVAFIEEDDELVDALTEAVETVEVGSDPDDEAEWASLPFSKHAAILFVILYTTGWIAVLRLKHPLLTQAMDETRFAWDLALLLAGYTLRGTKKDDD